MEQGFDTFSHLKRSVLRVASAALLVFACILLCACSGEEIPEGEYRYENTSLGISAYFPSEPTLEEYTTESEVYGAYPVADIKADSETGITQIIIHYSEVYAKYFKDLPEGKFRELQQGAIEQDLLNFCKTNGLSLASEPQIALKGDSGLQVVNTEDYRVVHLVVPLTFVNAKEGTEHEFYYYELKVFTDRAVCCLLGVRDTEEEAKIALDSIEFV